MIVVKEIDRHGNEVWPWLHTEYALLKHIGGPKLAGVAIVFTFLANANGWTWSYLAPFPTLSGTGLLRSLFTICLRT